MAEETKGIRIEKSTWKKLIAIKLDRDFFNMSQVIEHLLSNLKPDTDLTSYTP